METEKSELTVARETYVAERMAGVQDLIQDRFVHMTPMYLESILDSAFMAGAMAGMDRAQQIFKQSK